MPQGCPHAASVDPDSLDRAKQGGGRRRQDWDWREPAMASGVCSSPVPLTTGCEDGCLGGLAV